MSRGGSTLYAAALMLALGCANAQGPTPGRTTRSARRPLTRAERTQFAETSHYDDVMAFLDSLVARAGASMTLTSYGRTTEGRRIPFAVLSRPAVSRPEEAKALGRPIVYVQANIHAGEVEGKEALLALMRDLALDSRRNVLDSLVLIAVPIYNADGNERFAPQQANRGEQNGPEMVGQRANGQGLDLNRDYVKAEAPETRMSLEQMTRWDPQVFVDLHTTDGSFHGYALTYSPSLNPAALFGGVYARDSMLPQLRARMRSRHRFELFDYGNFISGDSVEKGWSTYDARPRFGTNYVGLRNRIGILSEAYSHDPFERRVRSTYAFVSEILSLVAERSTAIRSLTARGDSATAAWSRAGHSGPPIALRSEITHSPVMTSVRVERMAHTADSVRHEPGVPPGLARGPVYSTHIPLYDRFVPTLSRTLPYSYLIPVGETTAVRILKVHGVEVQNLTRDWSGDVERFVIDSVDRSVRPFQGHHEVRLSGHWLTDKRTVPAGSWIIQASQPLGLVAFYLLEPESDDGLATWNVFDPAIARGAEFPVLRYSVPAADPHGSRP
ncbi:MAG: M14 family metallopeptidase [Gemmatimonadaceae bacterium]